MNLIRWSPFNLTRWPSIWEDEDFSDLTTRASDNLDVYETDEEVVVKANVAGVPSKDVDVTYEKGVLWIKAEVQKEADDEDKKHYARSSWTYSYKVAVPGMIDQSAEPKAEVDNGVLTVTFKKSEASKPRKLEVKSKKK